MWCELYRWIKKPTIQVVVCIILMLSFFEYIIVIIFGNKSTV